MTISTNCSRPLELGFLSPHNPYDRQSFSGSTFHAARALARWGNVDLRILGPHAPLRFRDRLIPRRQKDFVLTANDFDGLDAVVGLVATPLLESLSHLRPDLPFLHVTDATPAFLRDVYGWNVPASADAREARVAACAVRTIYSSSEMALRAPGDLGLPGLRAKVVPFGMNDEYLPGTLPEKAPLTHLNLLFVGLNWIRKGGDIAIAALDELRAMGQNAHLTIVGQCPDQHRDHPHVTYAGFLNKNRARDARQLARLYSDAHLLLLPSRADCTPMVVAEAMGHGTPVIASETGGIGTMIGEAAAGRLISQFSPPSEWAEAIREMTACPDRYAFLSAAGFDRAHTVLSWSRWAEDVVMQLREAQQGNATAAAA